MAAIKRVGSTFHKIAGFSLRTGAAGALAAFVLAALVAAQQQARILPPRAELAQRFLARRGNPHAAAHAHQPAARRNSTSMPATPITATWQPLGPAAVASINYGLTSGRVTSLALDPSDPTGNRLFVGTTGGGVWLAPNAATADATQVLFAPLTDAALTQVEAVPPTPSIGALSVKPGGSGVILAGTGDPNDALDSYYGDGILRSTDHGRTWTRIESSADRTVYYSFAGLGFAGFAWSTVHPDVVVAAVSHAYEASLVNAEQYGSSYTGLYYSTDSGATWNLSQIKDLNGQAVQGPLDAKAGADGNPVTAVVWNPIRNIFIAAVRFHGFYQSPDGVTWTRLASQPGTGLTNAMCPTNHALSGSRACPVFRGALAVNPVSGDTFAWSVDVNNQDQGVWQDVCAPSGGVCTSNAISFSKQWSTIALDTNTWQGSNTILDGDYNLALAAVPSGQDTLLIAGDNDVWKCSLAMTCAWRNTTNVNTCMAAQVAPYQHVFEWNLANPQQILIGNDGGLWRSMDAIGETGSVCSTADDSHWQNLNGGLGSLAEVESMAAAGPTTLLAGLGAQGTAGIKGGAKVSANWPEILGGEGGPVAIDPADATTWYVNNGAGVSIRVCKKPTGCMQADFGSTPAIGNANVDGDGSAMTAPAPFLVDPVDPTQLLVGTCRIWRGPASGAGWTLGNAVSPMFDGNVSNPACHGNALIRSIGALALPGGAEVVYAGTYGSANGGASLPGHVLRGAMNTSGTWTWQDLTHNPVTNDTLGLNATDVDISSVFVDPSDSTGNTVYITLAGLTGFAHDVQPVIRTTDGGAHWISMWSNLPPAPANAVAVDPSNSNIVYVGSDAGVFVTQAAATCGHPGVNCWAAYGAGLPQSPVTALSLVIGSQTLLAATYGRGIWQTPLLGASWPSTTATAQPIALTFPGQIDGTVSAPLAVLLTNTGANTLVPALIQIAGDFTETDTCLNVSMAPGSTCSIQVTFSPSKPGSRATQLTIQGNIPGGSITVPVTGTGLSPGLVYFVPSRLDLGTVTVGSQSPAYSMMIENSSASAVTVTSLTVSGPFQIISNVCGSSLLPTSDCQLMLQFAPTIGGPATGTVTLVDQDGTQTAQLRGIATAPASDTLSPSSLTFPGVVIGQPSRPATITLTNNGSLALTAIQESATGPFSVASNCTTQLIGASSCSIQVTFTPTAQGTQTGVLTVSDALKNQTVPLTGTGLLPAVIVVNPTSLTFGGQVVGQPSAPLVLTISNSGGVDLAGLGFQITGTAAAAFSTGTTTCAATLSAGASCTLQIVFTPSATGADQASFTVTSSSAGVSPVSVALAGSGQSSAGLTAGPAQVNFAPAPVGTPSAPQTVTVTNSGGSAVSGLALSATGPFALAQNNCAPTLASAGTCTATVVFTPTQNGSATGTLSIHAANVANVATVALTGTGGLTGVLQAQPASIAFPVTGVGASSTPITVTLTNSGSTLALQGFTLTASTGFQVASTTCTASLAPGAACTAAITFSPSATGAVAGSVTLSSTTLAASTTVALIGVGFDFSITNPGSATQTIASGQTASWTLTVAPGGSDANFTFTCGTLPQYAACVFNPTSKSVAANATASISVQVTTSQTSAQSSPPWRPGLSSLVLACGLLCVPLCARKRRYLLPLIFVIVAGAAGLSGCGSSGGGGGGTPPPNPTTHTVAAGTYSIPVKITANGLEHTATLTLTVN